MLTPQFVINLFLICSVVFFTLGFILYYTSNNIYEFKHDYTECNDTHFPDETCHQQITKNISYKCQCRIELMEPRFQDETLYVYYMLDNYFQNVRRYDKSRDLDQLLGGRTGDYLSSECEPFRYHKKSNNLKLKYAPCGAVANSKFNDTFNIYVIQKVFNETVKLNISKQDLAWDSDRRYKYKNPSEFNNTIKPTNWAVNITQLESGYRNEDLMVWMRTAAFSSFRKLYGRIFIEENQKTPHTETKNENSMSKNDTTEMDRILGKSVSKEKVNKTKVKVRHRQHGLPRGKYFVLVDYKYPVEQFGGRKHFILATVSWIGGPCFFMAFSYIVIGCLCLVAAVVLFFLHVYFGNMDYNTAILLVDASASLVN